MPTYTDPTVDEILQLSDSATQEALDLDPIWSDNKLKDKKGDWAALRNWTQTTHESLIDPTKEFANVCIKNLALWLGFHYKSMTSTADLRTSDDDEVTVDSHKVIVNNIYDIERNRYSKITRNIPQTRATPKNTEYSAYAQSRVADAVLKTVKKITKQRRVVNESLRQSFIFGEGWVRVDWNKNKGKFDPRWEAAVKKLRNGEPKMMKLEGEDEPVLIDPDKPIYIGNHDLVNVLPWNLFPEPKPQSEEVEYIIEVDYVHIKTLKERYPAAAKKIIATEGAKSFNVNSLVVEPLKNHCLVYTVHGRSCPMMPNGIRYVCTVDVMLEEPTDNPHPVIEESEWGNLPYERLVDINVPGKLRGFSTVQILANLQHSENQMHTMIKHFLLLMGTPKMLIPREGNIDIDETSDDSCYIFYSNNGKPELMVPNPVPPQVVAFAEMLRERMQKLGDLHGVSSGDLPKSVRAARAIQMLQEMEDLRATSIFEKYNEMYVNLDRKLLAQTKHYKKSDGRLIMLLGKGADYLIEDFEAEDFGQDVTVELEITSMLPTAPSARAEFIATMQQMSGGQLFTPEKMTKMMGLDNEQEFIDAATVSVIKAQRENDMFVKNKKVPSPEPHEDHIVELKEHAVLLRSPSFSALPEKVKEKIYSHVRGHEYLLFLDMLDNPTLSAYVLQTQPWFPMVFDLPTGVGMAPMGAGMGAPQQPQQAQPQQQPPM